MGKSNCCQQGNLTPQQWANTVFVTQRASALPASCQYMHVANAHALGCPRPTSSFFFLVFIFLANSCFIFNSYVAFILVSKLFPKWNQHGANLRAFFFLPPAVRFCCNFWVQVLSRIRLCSLQNMCFLNYHKNMK